MKSVSFLLIAGLALFLLGTIASAAPKQEVYMDYDEFISVRALDPAMAEARLCGMNKTCMKLWKDGEMLVKERGMVVRADFDDNGEGDIGIAMEKDKALPDEGIDYFIMTASKQKDGTMKLMQTVAIPKANTIVETYWDALKKGIAVDSGERQLTSESTVTVPGDGKLSINFRPKTGSVQSHLTFLLWNNKQQRFDSQRGTVKS